jgi:hypothetical protein
MQPNSATASSQTKDDDEAEVSVSVVVDADGLVDLAPPRRVSVVVDVPAPDGDGDAETDTLLASLQPHPSANPTPPWRLLTEMPGLNILSVLVLGE